MYKGSLLHIRHLSMSRNCGESTTTAINYFGIIKTWLGLGILDIILAIVCSSSNPTVFTNFLTCYWLNIFRYLRWLVVQNADCVFCVTCISIGQLKTDYYYLKWFIMQFFSLLCDTELLPIGRFLFISLYVITRLLFELLQNVYGRKKFSLHYTCVWT